MPDFWGMECPHCGASYTTGAQPEGGTHPLCPYCKNGHENRCPECGRLGRYKATNPGPLATRIYECPHCVQHGIDITGERPYTFPYHFGSDGKAYI